MKPQQADSKGRVNLGSSYSGKLFQMTVEDDGRIILDPAVLVPERELWLHKNGEAKDTVEKGLEGASHGGIRKESVDLERGE